MWSHSMCFWNCAATQMWISSLFLPLIKEETKRSNNQREKKTHTKANIQFETRIPAENRQLIWDAGEYPKKKGNQECKHCKLNSQALGSHAFILALVIISEKLAAKCPYEMGVRDRAAVHSGDKTGTNLILQHSQLPVLSHIAAISTEEFHTA